MICPMPEDPLQTGGVFGGRELDSLDERVWLNTAHQGVLPRRAGGGST